MNNNSYEATELRKINAVRAARNRIRACQKANGILHMSPFDSERIFKEESRRFAVPYEDVYAGVFASFTESI